VEAQVRKDPGDAVVAVQVRLQRGAAFVQHDPGRREQADDEEQREI